MTGVSVVVCQRRFRGFTRLLPATALMISACGTIPEAPTGTTSVVPTSAISGTYANMLSRQGIEIAIPPRGKFVLINIPSFELIALQDGTPVLRSRVIVGRPPTPTPVLLSSMIAVKFNPSWMPTPAMMRYEGARYAPPGPRNPLGAILFELDNDQLIFLHDTNDRSLFNRPERAFSHGCVRVEQARALAAWALGVSQGEIEAMISHGTTYSVPLSEPIPISLVYHTQFPDQDGQVTTHPDIYSRALAVGKAPVGSSRRCRLTEGQHEAVGPVEE